MLLYAAPMSSATPVVHALAELQVPYELVPIDLSAGDQRRPEFLALNPNGKVPTLVVDGIVRHLLRRARERPRRGDGLASALPRAARLPPHVESAAA
jgi:glutathione S-transferase